MIIIFQCNYKYFLFLNLLNICLQMCFHIRIIGAARIKDITNIINKIMNNIISTLCALSSSAFRKNHVKYKRNNNNIIIIADA